MQGVQPARSMEMPVREVDERLPFSVSSCDAGSQAVQAMISIGHCMPFKILRELQPGSALMVWTTERAVFVLSQTSDFLPPPTLMTSVNATLSSCP